MCATQQERNDRPTDYHDYVFREGRLIGDFDNMYLYSKEIPWHQDATWRLWSAQVGMLMVKDRAPYDYILEIGCGLGYVSALLGPLARKGVHGVDVSPEAIRQAKELHPDIEFSVGDITDPRFETPRQYELVVIRDLFWYVFPAMETVMAHIRSAAAPWGYVYVCQSFPALDKPFVGKEVIPSPEALLGHFSDYCLVYSATVRNHTREQDGPILHFLSLESDKGDIVRTGENECPT